jgi:hypothetical protein
LLLQNTLGRDGGNDVNDPNRTCRRETLARLPPDAPSIMLKYRLPAHHGHDENRPKLIRIPAFTRLLVFVKS